MRVSVVVVVRVTMVVVRVAVVVVGVAMVVLIVHVLALLEIVVVEFIVLVVVGHSGNAFARGVSGRENSRGAQTGSPATPSWRA